MRASRGISQLELGLRLGVSQRHISFVELARANPSRSLILSWARETGATHDELSAALVSAGFTPNVLGFGNEYPCDSPAFRALSDMLNAHDPYPGIIFDADWMIHAMSRGGQWLCEICMPEFLRTMEGPIAEMDMIAAVTHPGGLLACVENASDVGFALLHQLRTEQLTRPSLQPRIDGLEASLLDRYGACDPTQRRAPGEPYVELFANTPAGRLSFLLVQTVFGLPQNVSHASLRTELWFPTNEKTRHAMATGLLP